MAKAFSFNLDMPLPYQVNRCYDSSAKCSRRMLRYGCKRKSMPPPNIKKRPNTSVPLNGFSVHPPTACNFSTITFNGDEVSSPFKATNDKYFSSQSNRGARFFSILLQRRKMRYQKKLSINSLIKEKGRLRIEYPKTSAKLAQSYELAVKFKNVQIQQKVIESIRGAAHETVKKDQECQCTPRKIQTTYEHVTTAFPPKCNGLNQAVYPMSREASNQHYLNLVPYSYKTLELARASTAKGKGEDGMVVSDVFPTRKHIRSQTLAKKRKILLTRPSTQAVHQRNHGKSAGGMSLFRFPIGIEGAFQGFDVKL